MDDVLGTIGRWTSFFYCPCAGRLVVRQGRQQQRRIAILARYLSGHDVEKEIQTLSQGYSRVLDEPDPARSEQV